MKSEFILPSAYALIDVDDGTVTDECGKKLKTVLKQYGKICSLTRTRYLVDTFKLLTMYFLNTTAIHMHFYLFITLNVRHMYTPTFSACKMTTFNSPFPS